MVEIRVVVTDATHLHGLMRRLGGLCDRLPVGDRSYTMVAPTALAALEGRAA